MNPAKTAQSPLLDEDCKRAPNIERAYFFLRAVGPLLASFAAAASWEPFAAAATRRTLGALPRSMPSVTRKRAWPIRVADMRTALS